MNNYLRWSVSVVDLVELTSPELPDASALLKQVYE